MKRRSPRSRGRRGRRPRIGAIVARGIGIVLLVFLLITAIPVVALRWLNPPTTAFMLQRRIDARLHHDRNYLLHYRWIDADSIAVHAGVAVVAAEDQKFPHHAGFDLGAIADAQRDHERGGRLRGASTITQQVAKNLFLWPDRSWARKGLEAYFTVLIEVLWSKRRILEVYLNVAEFGEGIFGVRAASETFFHKPPIRLQPAEAALLAAVLPNPVQLRVDRPSAYVRERRDWILGQMEQLGGPAYLRGIIAHRSGR